MNILHLIASDSFITVNKELIKQVGLEGAVLIGELASEFDYWSKNNGITEDGYFFSTIENIEEKTGVSEHKQRQAIKKLEELGILSVKVKGLPAKRYVKLNEQSIIKLFETGSKKPTQQVSEISETSTGKIQEQDLENSKRNNNINNNNIINNNINNVETSSTSENKSKRISRKDQFLEYVNSLSYSAETKDVLFKWIFQIGLPKGVTVAQLRDMLKKLWEECNDESLVREAIYNSYLRNWFGFYKPNIRTVEKKSTDIHIKQTQPVIEQRAVRLSSEIF